jgi:hypothetical protein
MGQSIFQRRLIQAAGPSVNLAIRGPAGSSAGQGKSGLR